MDHKALENMSNSELLVEIDEIESERDNLRVLHEEAVKSRNNLSAELERVKAERDEATRIVDEIWEMFYGQNLDVANWHQNGDLEPMNNFFEENDWLLDTTSESCRAAGGAE